VAFLMLQMSPNVRSDIWNQKMNVLFANPTVDEVAVLEKQLFFCSSNGSSDAGVG
jgi:hypothetical protein